ncbi:MAG TPA: hypothetical protein VKD89_09635 [Candidatus Udaeobacter sp.]|nr:hypothetical protein [Candidatus Udaeobacter sp.]
MAKKLMSLLGIAVIGGSATLVAQEGAKPANVGQGTLTLKGKNYPLKNAVAYETTVDGEEGIAVVLSGPTISSEKLNLARKSEKAGEIPDFRKPYVKLEFTKAGEFKGWGAGASDISLGRHSSNATGELKLQDGRVIGKASQPNETEGMFPSGLDVRFDVRLLRVGESLPPSKKPGPAANVKPTVTGEFKGNGKEAKLAYVSAHWREPFGDKPSMVLVFTEKDHSKDKKPDFNAGFGKFGSALVVSLHEDGDIFGCEVAHSSLKHKNFSSIGTIKTNDFEYGDGQVKGELTTDGEAEVFGEAWGVNVQFVAPLGEIPKEFQPAASTENEENTPEKPATTEPTTELSEKRAPKPAKDQLNAKDLALTKDASDIDYKTLVEQLGFKSKGNVKSVCAELSANLKAQGWTKDGSDLITPVSAILKRKRGDAALTIFVKPESGGSEVKMMTEGLAWDEK